MFTLIDHVMICVPDLERGIEQYTKLGFNIHAGGVHPGQGTHNAIAFNGADYVELLAIRDPAEAAGRWGAAGGTLAQFIEAGGGIRYIVLQSDDLQADVQAMRGRGVRVSDVIEGSRLTSSGTRLQWQFAFLSGGSTLPVFFIQHLTALEVRRAQLPGAGTHPNGVHALERAYIVVPDVKAAAQTYAQILGMPQPDVQRGTVIMADMAVFQLGATGLGIAQPYAPGPAAEWLERRGSGAFQALYRTSSMGAAARWMQAHGIPPLPRGVRNTGEQAMLATPEIACGAYIGFVGPE